MARRLHGKTPPGLYMSWKKMRYRCSVTTHPSYSRYGGRGITVASEWTDYEVFREWALANGWAPGLEIDRIDNDGNYEPGNCRWLDRLTHARRQSTLTHGKVIAIRSYYATGQWTQQGLGTVFGVSKRTVGRIVRRQRWPE